MLKQSQLITTVAVCMVVTVGPAVFAQSDARGKSYTLFGIVEGIYDSTQSIRVNQEKIEGFSDARVATYGVDDPTILKKLQLDDHIVADDVLYDIRVVRIDDRIRPPNK